MRLVYGRVAVTVERPQVDRVRGAASRAAHPQKPIASGDGGADRGRTLCKSQRSLSIGANQIGRLTTVK